MRSRHSLVVKKIRRPRVLFHQACVVESQNVLAALPDRVGGMSVAPLGDECARRGDALPAERAVQPDPHESAGLQHVEKHAPTLLRIAEMMKHAHHLDDVERLPEAFELKNIGMAELDIGNAELAGFARGIAETRPTQVDRQDFGGGMKLRGFDRMPSGAATCDQDFQIVPRRLGKPNVRKLSIHPVGK
jgi:hypothetical protein